MPDEPATSPPCPWCGAKATGATVWDCNSEQIGERLIQSYRCLIRQVKSLQSANAAMRELLEEIAHDTETVMRFEYRSRARELLDTTP